ncbi:MerR family transcriptional regulator, partial [Streptomyces halstedii]|uniref:MerR family transcriptional regulator n=2 Tax=Streptomyces TaxID=1883 RepID=UPI0033B2967F
MEELAKEAGITVRTLRFYRERGLIPPPRREGRIAWYDDHHLARLRTIAGLLERGHTLNGIADLAATFESGRDVAEVLGLGEPTEETPV